MKLYVLRKMIEEMIYVDEILDMSDAIIGKVYFLIKCNENYVADLLSGENKFKRDMDYLQMFLPIGIKLEYDVTA